MSTVLLGVACVAGSLILAVREIRVYKNSLEGEDDLFKYSRRRLTMRGAGLLLLSALGLTFIVWTALPPTNAQSGQRYLLAFAAQTVGLILIALVDLRETRRTANALRAHNPDAPSIQL